MLIPTDDYAALAPPATKRPAAVVVVEPIKHGRRPGKKLYRSRRSRRLTSLQGGFLAFEAAEPDW